MSTPFEYIRRHQKVALTAVTGMAILSFLLGDVMAGGQMSPLVMSSLIVGCFALVGWVWGTSDGKSSENAIFGGVLGLALTLVFMFMTRPPAAGMPAHAARGASVPLSCMPARPAWTSPSACM